MFASGHMSHHPCSRWPQTCLDMSHHTSWTPIPRGSLASSDPLMSRHVDLHPFRASLHSHIVGSDLGSVSDVQQYSPNVKQRQLGRAVPR